MTDICYSPPPQRGDPLEMVRRNPIRHQSLLLASPYHGCWETFYNFACCGIEWLISKSTELLLFSMVAPLPTSTKLKLIKRLWTTHGFQPWVSKESAGAELAAALDVRLANGCVGYRSWSATEPVHRGFLTFGAFCLDVRTLTFPN